MGNAATKQNQSSRDALVTYSTLINMNFDEHLSMEAVKKYRHNTNKCIDYIISHKEHISKEKQQYSFNDTYKNSEEKTHNIQSTNKVNKHVVNHADETKINTDNFCVKNPAARRLLTELKQLKSNLPNGCVADAYPQSNDILTWNAYIKGPLNSPYEGGTFIFKIIYSTNYPFQP
eukprot:327072_1